MAELPSASSAEELRAHAREEIDALQNELSHGHQGAMAAVLHHEIGRYYQTKLGDLRQAVAHYQAAFKADANHVTNLQSARLIFVEKENWNMAFQLLEAEVKVTPPGPARAALLWARGRIAADHLDGAAVARQSFEEALAEDAQSGRAFEALEALLQRESQWEPLAALYERSADKVDGPARAVMRVAHAELLEKKLARPGDSVKLYEAALDADAGCRPAVEALERLYQKDERWADLATLLRRGADGARSAGKAEQEVRLLYRMARLCAERLDRADEAIEALERALDRFPNDLLCLTDVSRLYEAQGAWKKYVEAASRVAAQIQDRNELTALHARIAEVAKDRLGEDALATRHHEQAIALTPTYLPSLQALGGLYARAGAWDKLADMHLREADETDDPRQRTAKFFKVAELQEGPLADPDGAIVHYGRALEASPGFLPAIKALSRLYAKRGRWQDLIALYEKEADEQSEPGQVNFLLGKIGQIYEEKLDDVPAAIAVYRRILDHSAGDLNAIRALGRLYDLSAQWEELVRINEMEAEQTIDQRRVIALLQKNGEIFEEKLQRPDEAIACYQKVIKVSPTYLPALQALGRLYFRTERWKDLVTMYRREAEVTRGPTQLAGLLYKVGLVHDEKLKDAEGAAEAFRAALDAAPDYLPALRALAQLHRRSADWRGYAELCEREARTLADLSERAAALFRVGEIYEHRLASPDAAADMYREALQVKVDFEPAREAALALFLATERYAAAADLLRQRLEQGGMRSVPEADMRRRLGELLADRMGDAAAGFGEMERGLALDPSNVVLLHAMEPLAVRLGRWERLADVYDALGGHDAGAPAAALYLEAAWLRARVGDAGGAVLSYRRAFEAVPGEPVALLALERLLRARGDDDELIHVYRARLAGATDAAERAAVAMRLGDLLSGASRAADAAAAYEDAAAAVPGHLPALRALLHVYQKLKRWDDMKKVAATALASTKDPRAAAEQHFVAAVLALENGREEEGVADLRKALEVDAAHRAAGDRLEEIFARHGQWKEVLGLLERRAEACAKSPEVASLLHYRAGVLQREKLGDKRGAVASFNRALRADPQHVSTLQALADLYGEQDQWNEAAAVLAHAADAATDAGIKATLKKKLAEILDARLGAPDRAKLVLETVLLERPADMEALEKLSQLHHKAGELEDAAEGYRRVAEMGGDPGRRAEALVGLADVREKMGDADGAAAALAAAGDLASSDDAVAEKVGAFYGRLGRWDKLVELYEGRAQSLAVEDPARAVPLMLQSGDVLLHKLGDAAGAEARYRTATELMPTAGEAHLKLAEALSRSDARNKRNEAAEEYLSLLTLDPFHAGALKGLGALWRRDGRTDAAFSVGLVMSYLKVPDDEMQRLVEQSRPRAPRAPTGTLDGAAWKMVAADTVPPEALSLLGAIDGHLSALYKPALEAHGVGRNDRLAESSASPVRALVDEVARALGGPFELELYAGPGDAVALENGEPPALVVGSALADRASRPEQRFVVARELCAVAQRWVLARKLGGVATLQILCALARGVVPGTLVPSMSDAAADELSKKLLKALPRKVRSSLDGPAAAFAKVAAAAKPRAFAQGLDELGLRVGTLLAGDATVVVEALRRKDPKRIARPMGSYDEVVATLAGADEVALVLSFALSHTCLDLRRKLGLALSG
jgi:tetratricopeptide (TPR) repeat protein